MPWIGLGAIAIVCVILIATHGSGQVGNLPADDFARLSYLLILGVPLVGALILRARGRMGETLKQATVWLALMLALVAGYGYRAEFKAIGNRTLAMLAPGRVAGGGGEAVVARGRDGHFLVSARANGHRLDLLVDTGASTVALSFEDARAIGIDTDRLTFDQPTATANGGTLSAATVIDNLAIGSIRLGPVKALVSRPGSLRGSLMGMNVLDRLSSYRVEGDTLILTQ